MSQYTNVLNLDTLKTLKIKTANIAIFKKGVVRFDDERNMQVISNQHYNRVADWFEK